MNVYVISNVNNKFLCKMNYIPRKNENIIIRDDSWHHKEYIVIGIVYEIPGNDVCVFVAPINPSNHVTYSQKISDIEWH